MRQLDISDDKQDKDNIDDLKTFGDSVFVLLSKASSEKEGFMKSTKVCNVPGGCLVQVTTQQRNPNGSYAVAEALTYVPNVGIDEQAEPRRMVPVSRVRPNGDLMHYTCKACKRKHVGPYCPYCNGVIPEEVVDKEDEGCGGDVENPVCPADEKKVDKKDG